MRFGTLWALRLSFLFFLAFWIGELQMLMPGDILFELGVASLGLGGRSFSLEHWVEALGA